MLCCSRVRPSLVVEERRPDLREQQKSSLCFDLIWNWISKRMHKITFSSKSLSFKIVWGSMLLDLPRGLSLWHSNQCQLSTFVSFDANFEQGRRKNMYSAHHSVNENFVTYFLCNKEHRKTFVQTLQYLLPFCGIGWTWDKFGFPLQVQWILNCYNTEGLTDSLL